MLDFHIVSCSCHGQMILVRALGVVGDAGTQVSGRDPLAFSTNSHETLPGQTASQAFGNTEPALGFEPTQVSARGSNPPQPSLIDPAPTPTSGVAVAIHPNLPPIIPPAVHCGVCGAIEVPQRPYRSALLFSDPTYENEEVIVFSQGRCGVSIVDAFEGRISGLFGGDDLMFADTAVSTFSIRIEVRTSSQFRTITLGAKLGFLRSGRGTRCGMGR